VTNSRKKYKKAETIQMKFLSIKNFIMEERSKMNSKKIIKKPLAVFMGACVLCSAFGSGLDLNKSNPAKAEVNVSTPVMVMNPVTEGKINEGFKTETYTAAGDKKIKFKIKDLSIVNDSKQGYKKITFSAKFIRVWKPSKKDVKKCAKKKSYRYGGFVSVADYFDGKCLEANNDKNIKVESVKGRSSNKKTYKDNFGHKVTLWDQKIKFTITCPSAYVNSKWGSGIVLLYGGLPKKSNNADKAYWEGSASFADTSYYKDYKDRVRSMHLSWDTAAAIPATQTAVSTATPAPASGSTVLA
jgi:hypothetical protein